MTRILWDGSKVTVPHQPFTIHVTNVEALASAVLMLGAGMDEPTEVEAHAFALWLGRTGPLAQPRSWTTRAVEAWLHAHRKATRHLVHDLIQEKAR